MKDLRAATKMLRMEIRRDRKAGKLWLSQKKYISKVLKKFNMQNAKPVSTPLAGHFSLSDSQCLSMDEEIEEMSKISYANVVECLMYTMVCTKPDIAQPVGVVSKYIANPVKEHWDAVKSILRYLKDSKDL